MAASKVAQAIHKALQNIYMLTNFEVRNIVATCDIKELNITKKEGSILNLSDIFNLKLPDTLYEPELFPGLIYKFKNVKLVVFHTGKVNFTGAKTEMEIIKAYDVFLSILLKNKLIEFTK